MYILIYTKVSWVVQARGFQTMNVNFDRIFVVLNFAENKPVVDAMEGEIVKDLTYYPQADEQTLRKD